MKLKTWFNLFMVVALALGSAFVIAGQAAAQAPESDGPYNPQAAVGTAFTYQGRLTDSGGNPTAGPCDFQFSLWTAGSGGSQVGSTQTVSNQALINGYFGATLDFGSSAFEGEARHLQIAVRCPAGSGNYTTLNGRVTLAATPYAHSLRPGASVSSSGNTLYVTTSGTSGGAALNATASAASGTAAAVYALGNSPDGAALSAYSTGYGLYATGGKEGVYAQTSSAVGYGLHAKNTNPGSNLEEPTAIFGEVNSADGFAIYGKNDTGRGIIGEGNNRYGVGGFSDSSYGVFGKSNSGPGVLGEGGVTGTVGIADVTSGNAWGVYGKTSSQSGYGVYGYNDNASSGVGVYGEGTTRGVLAVSDEVAVYGHANGGTYPIGVFGEAATGVEGDSASAGGAGGRFKNTYTVADENNVGVWAGSWGGDIFQGHELDSGGLSTNRRFRVTYTGNVYADGTYYGAGGVSAGGADFAEMVKPGQSDLEPGDVLAIGSDGNFVRSSSAYQSTVVGVYSTRPGFTAGNVLNDNDRSIDPNRIPLAVVGIVPVKASAENGSIQPGDMLVASSTPGHAMKSGPRAAIGTVIGKALAGLDHGIGVISILVILQ